MGVVFAQSRCVVAIANPFQFCLASFFLFLSFSSPQSIIHQLHCTPLFHVTPYINTTASHRWYGGSLMQVVLAFSLSLDYLRRVC